MHIMMKKYPASLCSMREHDFLLILWGRNILQVFVWWENMIFYAYYDEEISCKSLFHERIWFFMHIMIKEYPASLCSMREHDFLFILWWRNILQVFVQWENMIFYSYYDEEISCKSLFSKRIWFFMHIMMKKYPASLCLMREYDFWCILW
jgi:aromatic ring hydroxylase